MAKSPCGWFASATKSKDWEKKKKKQNKTKQKLLLVRRSKCGDIKKIKKMVKKGLKKTPKKSKG